ncbi:MAG: hypothetical protein V4520_17530 [Bacteroidota bacterium]
MLLILFIGCKMLAPVFGQVKLFAKETSAGTEDDDKDGEKKTEPNTLEKDFAGFYSNQPIHIIWDINVVHLTHYSNSYQSAYYNTITIPPPDRS